MIFFSPLITQGVEKDRGFDPKSLFQPGYIIVTVTCENTVNVFSQVIVTIMKYEFINTTFLLLVISDFSQLLSYVRRNWKGLIGWIKSLFQPCRCLTERKWFYVWSGRCKTRTGKRATAQPKIMSLLYNYIVLHLLFTVSVNIIEQYIFFNLTMLIANNIVNNRKE